MKTKDITLCAMFAAIIVVFSQITIPLIGGVPLTLQTFIIPITGIIIGAKRGSIATLIYVLIGAVGLPVFSNFTGGFGAIIGPTGGFIISFPLMAYISGFFLKENSKRVSVYFGVILGTIVNYIFGVIGFSIILGKSISQSVAVCVTPFIIATIVKVILSSELGLVIKSKAGKILK